MAGCGYVCPQCEGKGFTDDGSPCDWCSMPVKEAPVKPAGDLKEQEETAS